jgi:Flp pilus assembly protein TadD
VLNSISNPADADFMLQVCHKLNYVNPASGDVNYLMGKIFGQVKGNLDSSEVYLLRAIALSPKNIAAYKDLGVLYGMRKNFGKALEMFNKAAELDPDDQQVKQNINITNHFIEQGGRK